MGAADAAMQALTAEMPVSINSDAGAGSACSDHDGDCQEVVDKVHCCLYDPQRGMCPYLKATNE